MSEKNEMPENNQLQNALAGNYDFDVKQVISEGWELTKTSKAAILQGVGFVFVICVMVMLLAQSYTQAQGQSMESPDVQMVLNIVLLVLVAPFAAALVMMGINTSVGKQNTSNDIFKFVSRTFIITITSVITAALVQIGMLLFILPGFYMLVATGFAIPLVLDKGMLPTQAVFSSIRIVNHQWLKFVQVYIVFFILLVLVVFTFGLAMIWVAPFYYNVKGLLYRDIIGTGDNKGTPRGMMEQVREDSFQA